MKNPLPTVTSIDIAEYILSKYGPQPAMKLQKIVYYSQAWSLVWDERQMFDDDIEAWANGPVCPKLYAAHRLSWSVTTVNGDIENLDDDACKTIDAVYDYYGNKTAQWLSDLTHAEDPWIQARGDTPPGERSEAVITPASMKAYYGSL